MNGLLGLIRDRRVILIAQIAIALVFLVAALGKISNPGAFARQISYFRLTPAGFENTVAITLPWIELLAALSLLLRVQPRAGGLVTAGLMVLFVGVVGVALARGLDIECGCFGTSDGSRVGAAKLIENIGLLALAAIASLKPAEPRPAVQAQPLATPDRAAV